MPITVRQIHKIAKDRCEQMQDIAAQKLRDNGASQDDMTNFWSLMKDIDEQMFGRYSRHSPFVLEMDLDVDTQLNASDYILWIPRTSEVEEVMGLRGDSVLQAMIDGYDVLVRDDEGGG